jgi:hypothetical protein
MAIALKDDQQEMASPVILASRTGRSVGYAATATQAPLRPASATAWVKAM